MEKDQRLKQLTDNGKLAIFSSTCAILFILGVCFHGAIIHKIEVYYTKKITHELAIRAAAKYRVEILKHKEIESKATSYLKDHPDTTSKIQESIDAHPQLRSDAIKFVNSSPEISKLSKFVKDHKDVSSSANDQMSSDAPKLLGFIKKQAAANRSYEESKDNDAQK